MLSTGKMPPNPSEMLGSNKMRDILGILEKNSDIVVIDAPPVLSVIDAVALAPAVDGVLLVVRPGRTRMSGLKHSVDQLRHVGATIVGVVFNDVNPSSPQYGYYYKSYDYYSTYNYGSNGHMNHDGKNGHKGFLIKERACKPASRRVERKAATGSGENRSLVVRRKIILLGGIRGDYLHGNCARTRSE